MECSVCFSEFTAVGSNRPMTLSPCGHGLCNACFIGLPQNNRVCPECVSVIDTAIPNRLVVDCLDNTKRLSEENSSMKQTLLEAEAVKNIRVYIKFLRGQTLSFSGTLNSRCRELKQHICTSYNRNNDDIRHLICNGNVLVDEDRLKDGDVIFCVFHAL